MGKLISKLEKLRLVFKNGSGSLENLHFENIGLFCEVSIIRDAYQNVKSNVNPFMDDLTRLIMKQEKVSDCRLYSQLDKPLNDISKTHPKQIRQKAIWENIHFSEDENKVYGAMQAMFNSKPDLVITIDNKLLSFEAKFTEPFDVEQLKRTWNITEVWATLLHKDLGFSKQPEFTVAKLGARKFNPDINWTDILDIAQQTYSINDRSLIAIKSGVELLQRYSLE
ncbi:MAG: hypothetical protein KGZ58_09330 [Ignavibacteriales bacterium]|nr:hypothetical protein [Ignavibacteriales bacterium]